jgi:hypothetical protein
MLLFDSQKHCRVPLIQARNAIVVLNGVSEAINILFFKMFDECLEKEKVRSTVSNCIALNSP